MNKLVRAVSVVLAAAALCSSVFCFSYANGEAEAPPITIKAKSSVLMDASTGKILMKFNENEKVFPASLTKIMSLLIIAEAIDGGKIAFNDVVTASAEAASKGGSQIWLKEGEQMTVEDLLKAVAVYSANDACVALGEHLSGSEEAFVASLNEKAKALGMTNTHFDNCTGLDDSTDSHLTTALDVAIMSRELLKHKFIMNYTTVWTDSLREGKTEIVNTNKLVRFYKGATGIKTGTTSKAGCCISASALRDGSHLIAVVMGSDNGKDRFETAKAALNWGFANYATVKPVIDPASIPDVGIINGVKDKIKPKIPEVKPALIKKGEESKVTETIDLAANVEAPVEKGQTLGTVEFKLGDEALGEYKLTAPESVEPLTFLIVFKRILLAMTSQFAKRF